MNHRRVVIAAALAIGLVPVSVLFISRYSGGSAGLMPAAAVGENLPWPYCAPDAKPPALTQVAAVGGGERPLVIPPLADALLLISELGSRSAPMTEPGFEGSQVAIAQIQAPLFQSESSVGNLGALSSGSYTFVSDESLWTGIADRLGAGHAVALAVNARWDDGTLEVPFAADLGSREILRFGPAAELDKSAFAKFMASEFPAVSAGGDFADFLVSWNSEQGIAKSGGRPISDAWNRFLVNEYGIGLQLPAPGSAEWWNSAPPECRSLLDAPPSVLAGLRPVSILVEVPPGLTAVNDAVLCIRIGLGSMGCSVFHPEPDSPYVRFDAYSDGSSPISVQLARETPKGVSWVDRTTLASIPSSMSGSAAILVILDPSLAGSTYDELAAQGNIEASLVRALSSEEEQSLLAEAA